MTLYVDEPALEGGGDAPLRYLYRFTDGDAFAYVAHGNELVRVSDHGVWALEHDDVLVSARSGEPLAYRLGKVYFAAETGEPLYYERAH